MLLTVEAHREAIRRYAHIKPARGWGARRCAAKCPGSTRTCSRARDHRGPHVAHGRFRRILAVWDAGTGGPARSGPGTRVAEARRPPRPAKRPVGLPTRSPIGLLQTARDFAARTLTSADEIAFIVLFIVLVKFAIDVLMTLH